jgi:hypothetical protein
VTRSSILALVLCALLGGSAARAEEHPAYDVGAVRDALRLLHDGKGHYVALVPLARCLPATDKLKNDKIAAVFYGDGKVFYHLRSTGGGAECGKTRPVTYYTMWEPRIPRRADTQIVLRDGKHHVTCGDRRTELKPVPEAEGRDRIAKAKFLTQLWRRTEYALLRDERGTYYFVDVLGEARPGRDHRLFVGPRGNLKLQRMKNVVSDSEGDIFATQKGELRLVLSRDEAFWIAGKKRTKLVKAPVADNQQLIYADLGPYVGERLGTPCDDM